MGAQGTGGLDTALPGLEADLARLDELARGVAAAWAPRTLAATTLGRERAILRLFGVGGLDRAGMPLAGAVVDRYVAGAPDRLARGVTLPFAMALVEYDEPIQELAIDVAAGHVDLAMEAELLAEPKHRTMAQAAAADLAERAMDRIDANRTARHDLIAVLSDPPRPWISTAATEPEARAAAVEAGDLVRAGFDVIRVEVPMGRELHGLLEESGIEFERWRPRPASARDGRAGGRRDIVDTSLVDLAPSGSQRGLAFIRSTIDEIAADRRAYVRLASAAPPLAAPEQAVVAAFERVDLVVADVMAEIVASGVDPDRALADHAFAATIHARAGTLVLVGPGPLVVGPDLAAGIPASTATRSGRALALQLLGIHMARAAGLAADQIVAGAVPTWLAEERLGPAFALAEVVIRRRLLPEHPLSLSVLTTAGEAGVSALAIAAGIAPADDHACVLHVAAPGHDRAVAASSARAALAVGATLAHSRIGAALGGVALDHAHETVRAAIRALDGLQSDGWQSILGREFDDPDRRRFGADAVTERRDSNDPFATLVG